MRTARVFYMFLIAVTAQRVECAAKTAGRVEGVAVDISDARIESTLITFTDRHEREYRTKTRFDGSYSINLKPGTYRMIASHEGFCTFRRAPFVVRGHSLRLNFQMWVCPTDTKFIRYTELKEVPTTHIQPLVSFASEELHAQQRWFRGPKTHDDGTGHPRDYPAIFTFNLLSVKADEIVYNQESQLITALGNAQWEDGVGSGAGDRVVIKLTGFNPKPTIN